VKCARTEFIVSSKGIIREKFSEMKGEIFDHRREEKIESRNGEKGVLRERIKDDKSRIGVQRV